MQYATKMMDGWPGVFRVFVSREASSHVDLRAGQSHHVNIQARSPNGPRTSVKDSDTPPFWRSGPLQAFFQRCICYARGNSSSINRAGLVGERKSLLVICIFGQFQNFCQPSWPARQVEAHREVGKWWGRNDRPQPRCQGKRAPGSVLLDRVP